jgi:hypothetical protein
MTARSVSGIDSFWILVWFHFNWQRLTMWYCRLLLITLGNQLWSVSATISLIWVYWSSHIISDNRPYQLWMISPFKLGHVNCQLADGSLTKLSITIDLYSINISTIFIHSLCALNYAWYVVHNLPVLSRRIQVSDTIPFLNSTWHCESDNREKAYACIWPHGKAY